MLNHIVKEKICSLIKQNDHGTCSIDISKKLKLNRITLSKYLSVLHSEGLIYYRDIGMAKVWYFHKTPPIMEYFTSNNGHSIKNVLDSLGTGVIVVDNKNKIVWVNKKIKDMTDKEMIGNKFSNIFNETNKCANDSNFYCSLNKQCCTDKNYICSHSTSTLEFVYNKEKKLTSTSSPILDSEKNPIGYIRLIKTH